MWAVLMQHVVDSSEVHISLRRKLQFGILKVAVKAYHSGKCKSVVSSWLFSVIDSHSQVVVPLKLA